MRQRSMNAIALVALATGFATTARADFAFSQGEPVLLGGGESFSFNLNTCCILTGFDWSFAFDDFGDDSLASDMQITITDPNGNMVMIAGRDTPGLAVSYGGPASGPPGIYGDNLALAGLSGTPNWTVTIANDWLADPNPNLISNFMGNLQGINVPAPGAGFVAILAIGAGATRRRRP